MKYRNLILVVCLLTLATIFVSFGVVGADIPEYSEADGQSVADNVSNTNLISPGVETSGDRVEVVIRFTELESSKVAASNSPIETLHSQADRTQAPFLKYAESQQGITIQDTFWVTNAVLIEVETEQVSLEQIASQPNVKKLHENFEIEATQSVTAADSDPVSPSVGTPSTESNGQYTYGLEQINTPQTWDRFDTKGNGSTVAVLDSGIDTQNHSALTPVSGGWIDFINHRSTPYDDNGHGTHVSGSVVGQESDQGSYAGTQYGVAPEADLLHGKVIDQDGRGDFTHMIEGMEWAIEHDAGVDIISLSLGADSYIEFVIDPVRNTKSAGISVVASSGNSGHGTSYSPANVHDAFAVGASAEDKTIASFSSGETVDTESAWSTPPHDWPNEYVVPDVAAPGSLVYSSVPGGEYEFFSGTSMAAPHVSGAMALMQSATTEQLTPDEMETELRETARKPDGEPETQDERYGDGIIDVYAATEKVTQEADFQLTNLQAPHSSEQNESYNVTVTATNIGDIGTQNVSYELRNESNKSEIQISEEVTLDGGESTNVTFEIDSEQTTELVGNYTHAVATDNDQLTQPVVFIEPAGEIHIEDQETTGQAVEIANATYNVDNFVIVLHSEDANESVDEAFGTSNIIDADTRVRDFSLLLVEPLETNQTVTATLYSSTDQNTPYKPIVVDGETLQDHAMITVVEDKTPSVEDYAIDGSYTRQSVFNAIADWRSNGLDRRIVFDVIAEWRSR